MNGLFDNLPTPGLARRDGPATMHAAADSVKGATGKLRRQVLDFLKERGANGATDDEMQKGLEMNPSTQRPRRVELQRAGLIVDSGGTRKTTSNRNAVVWRVA